MRANDIFIKKMHGKNISYKRWVWSSAVALLHAKYNFCVLLLRELKQSLYEPPEWLLGQLQSGLSLQLQMIKLEQTVDDILICDY